MKYDICLNGNKYVVEIESSKAQILEKKAVADNETDLLDLPDFDFGEEKNETSSIKATLPGTVIAVNVKVGEEVYKGQTMIILESMKMENPITAPCDCYIEHLSVNVGSYVKKDQELVSFKIPELAV